MASSNSLHRGCLLGATGWDDCFTHTASLNLRGDGCSSDVRDLSAAPEAVGLGRKRGLHEAKSWRFRACALLETAMGFPILQMVVLPSTGFLCSKSE